MRIIHTMIRVGDLEASLAFYRDVLGMELVRRVDMEQGRFTLAFLRFPGDDAGPELELTYNWDTREYELGTGYGHIAVEVADLEETVVAIRSRGGELSREPRQMGEGGPVIAFLTDPDGYAIELIQH